ncbi:hydroxymethylbilane synthase [Thermosulfidibacter takaii ABI70S6]|uniref:Porphobilinogen deaminase n=1 Tax=Thermosulfidibacter takaii (strain DSM 17441 / JCM 13301 / NBRC 103674 / ABI70S6) TaxID=1298851 RepID=A0A0S3QW53_THET7|nr:hydroxymethylbilane synthase [Thermosulfidibacter takaii]BAT72564.1 hydroxymethylbilane synthase [Thermosulfidibacter takaii ABI70S6]
MKIRIGTRGSKLALWQANHVKEQIERKLGWEVELVIIKTKGDKITDVPLAKVGGKGLFVKEIEEALLRKEVDIAVHSLKDMPAELPEGLEIIAFTERESPWDLLISNEPLKLEDLAGKRVGTSSLRRTAQLKQLVPEANILTLRGNLDTRLRKLQEGQYDAIIVAEAGVKRLQVEVKYSRVLKEFIPAIGQGILAIEARKGEFEEIRAILDNPKSRAEATAERAFLEMIGGSCQIPVGAFAQALDGKLHLKGFIAHPSGNPFFKGEMEGTLEDAASTGKSLAEKLLKEGGLKILQEIGIC